MPLLSRCKEEGTKDQLLLCGVTKTVEHKRGMVTMVGIKGVPLPCGRHKGDYVGIQRWIITSGGQISHVKMFTM